MRESRGGGGKSGPPPPHPLDPRMPSATLKQKNGGVNWKKIDKQKQQYHDFVFYM